MSMSDCPKCWDTPCTCGYMGYTVKRLPGKSQYHTDKEAARLMKENAALKRRIEALEAAKEVKVKKRRSGWWLTVR